MLKPLLTAVAAAGLFALGACTDPQPAESDLEQSLEEAGNNMEDAAHDAGDALEEAGQDAEHAVEDATDSEL